MDKTDYMDPKYGEIKDLQQDWVAVLPWGSFEPHGEALSYNTDTLLATEVSKDLIRSINREYELLGELRRYVLLPPIGLGSQNPGQTNRRFCIHLSTEAQKNILQDIVCSLDGQGIKKLLIINGHNGNNFKSIVRDLEFKFKGFKILVCDYLSVLDQLKEEGFLSGIDFPKVDDHAGFTETALMLFNFTHGVNKDILSEVKKAGIDIDWNTPNSYLWSPRDWNEVSHETRVGDLPDIEQWQYVKAGDYMQNSVVNKIKSELLEYKW